ncbi:MAG: murein L,D-transpeptidase catalytic domain family protein [Chitinophagales bacterium]|nr:murein L,D-transpeptidase catalytic domain family protein [Chitinophagaceae bacterium]MCB9064799.1 murein L,D-transpeptidase catalytic domain family protein [Chitinophagales bacterium]
MKKHFFHIIFWLATSFNIAYAGDKSAEAVRVNTINTTYEQIDFSACTPLDYNVFSKAYQGYISLLKGDKLNDIKGILTVCDYSLSANEKRMWIIDLRTRKVLINTYVAHGQGSGEEYANKFSDRPNSHQSSIGFYVTGKTYTGKHGNSLHLHGMDEGYNAKAYERAIVVHGAGYVSRDFILGTGRLGRSWGCPAVSNDISDEVIELIKEGTCLFIYYPDNNYLQSSTWLNKS